MKLTLTPEPTFTAPVPIHVPGTGLVDVEFIFKHRGNDEIVKLQQRAKKMTTTAYVMEICLGWELDETFNKKNVDTFLNARPSAFMSIIGTYFKEEYGARSKN